MNIADIIDLLDLCPDAEVVVRPDGTLIVRRRTLDGRLKRVFVVRSDGTLTTCERPS